MSGDMDRVPIFLPGETVEAIEAVADEYSLSRSRIIRDLVSNQLADDDNLSDAVADAIDDDILRIARKRRQDELLRDKQEEIEKKASFDDRIRGYFRNRLEGDRAYSPDMMAELAEGYKTDAEIWFDDAAQIQDKKRLVDDEMEVYRAGYYARRHADSIDAELQPHNRDRSWMDIGDDLYRLRSRQEEIYQWVRERANSQSSDFKDTVVEYIAQEWSVGRAAVLLFLEQLVDDPSKNIKTMLRHGGQIMSDYDALGSGSTLSELADPTADDEDADEDDEPEPKHDDDMIDEYPTEPTDAMVTLAVEKYTLNGEKRVTEDVLLGSDMNPTLEQAEAATAEAMDIVDGSDEDADTAAATNGGVDQ